MQTFTDLAIQADAEIQNEKYLLEKQREQNQKDADLIMDRSKEVDARETAITVKEAELRERSSILSNKEKVMADHESAESLAKKNEESIRQIIAQSRMNDSRMGEIKQKEEEVAKRELAISEKEKNFKEEIRKKFFDNLGAMTRPIAE